MSRDDPRRNKRVLALIKLARGKSSQLPPRLTDMHFVRFVEDGTDEFAWSVYVSHDPCHDCTYDESRETSVCMATRQDRNTVIALHRRRGSFRIIGRELPTDFAYALANGEDVSDTPKKRTGRKASAR